MKSVRSARVPQTTVLSEGFQVSGNRCLILCLSIIFLSLCGASSAIAQSAPNILVLYVDDLRHDGLGVTGHPFAETPNLDALVADVGTVFNNSFVTTPVCSPSRASILSGQYVRTHGLFVNEATNYVEDSATPNYHSLLQTAGYRTGHIGKWHRDEHNSARPGYDYWAAFKGQGNHQGGTLNIEADGAPAQTDNYPGWTKDTLTDYAIDFIDDYGTSGTRTEPFALTLSFKAVHAPFGNTQTASGGDFASETVDRPDSTTPAYGGFDVHVEKTVFDRPGFSGPTPSLDKGVTQQKSQIEMMKDIDFQIGRVLDTLENQGLDDNTIVVFTSDNGFFWGEHGRGDKRAAYDESIRVPLLIRDPRQTIPASNSDATALNIDVAPTLLDAAGVAIPSWMQGQSLMPIITGQSTTTRTGFAAEYYQEVINQAVPTWEAYRSEDYLYVRYPAEGAQFDELYDLQADALQINNLLEPGDPSASVLTIRDQLRTQLSNELDSIDATNGFHRSLSNGHTSDFGINQQGAITDTPDNVYVGARSASGGSNLVLSFEVPVIPINETLQKAHVSVEIINTVGSLGSQDRVDLWAIGFSDGDRLEEFLEANVEQAGAERADNVKLQDSIITSDSHLSRNFSSDQAADVLADYLNDFYLTNPEYQGGKFLQLRLNPDRDFGNIDRSWRIANGDAFNSNSQAPYYKRLPALSLQLTTDYLLGDLNLDGQLTQSDLNLFAAQWSSNTIGLTPGQKGAMGDLNGDGTTDFSDWYIIRQAFIDLEQPFVNPFTSVPEPCSAIVLSIGLLGACCYRIRNGN